MPNEQPLPATLGNVLSALEFQTTAVIFNFLNFWQRAKMLVMRDCDTTRFWR